MLLCVENEKKKKKKFYNLRRRTGKPTICIGENKGADQLRSNCEADQRLCFHYTAWLVSEPKLLVFSCEGSFHGSGPGLSNLFFY